MADPYSRPSYGYSTVKKAKGMASLREGLGLECGGVVSLVGAGGKTSLMFRIAKELSKAGEPVLTTTTTKILMPTKKQTSHLILSTSPEEILKKARDLLQGSLHFSAAFGHLPSEGKLVGFQPEIIDELWRAKLFRWILVEADGAARRPLKAPASHEPVIPVCSELLIGIIGLDGAGKPLEDKWVFRPELYAEITGLALGEVVTERSIATVIAHPKGIMKGCPPNAMRIAFLNKADHPGGVEAGRSIAGLLGKPKQDGLKRVVIGQALYEPPVVEYYDMNHTGGVTWTIPS